MSNLTPALPQNLRKYAQSNTHPGLALDKFVVTVDQNGEIPNERENGKEKKWSELVQKPAIEQVVKLSRSEPGHADYAKVLEQQQSLWQSFQARVRNAKTTSALTMHLSRASALENAGICLHRIYGFVYLPGSGLKGMARAFATTVWKKTQTDQDQAQSDINRVFGNEPGEAKQELQQAGLIVFHDAWPTTWPKLQCDILNNHHSKYYQGEDAPGDWEAPIPVYFLSVPAGQQFRFAISKRRDDVEPRLLDLADQWLAGALTYLGAGAKTNSGYGAFELVGEPQDLKSAREKTWQHAVQANHNKEFCCTLELVTPAFLAGANHKDPSDCDLRPATLRGLLRWWWRAMHVGYLTVDELRDLEAALWGDTSSAGAISIEVKPKKKLEPIAYDKNAVARQHRLPRNDDRKTTQGLFYHSYGMHDGNPPKSRFYSPPGSSWQISFRVRPAFFVRKNKQGKAIETTAKTLPPEQVLQQATFALWWLCNLGGVGSKSRKGFGSFARPQEMEDFHGATFMSKGKEFRKLAGIADRDYKEEMVHSPSLKAMVELGRTIVSKEDGGNGWLEMPLSQDNVWHALDLVGTMAQQFAKKYKHDLRKKALGLPRNVGRPTRGKFSPDPRVNKTDRHTSPIHFHLFQVGKEYCLRMAAFPSPVLPDLKESKAFLKENLEFLFDYTTEQ